MVSKQKSVGRTVVADFYEMLVCALAQWGMSSVYSSIGFRNLIKDDVLVVAFFEHTERLNFILLLSSLSVCSKKMT